MKANHLIHDCSAGAAFVDDELVPIDQAKISILDWGFLHSDATYDVAHVWQGRFFRLNDHLDRFVSGMRKLRLSLPYDRGRLEAILTDCVRATGLRDAYVEMICTRGRPTPGSRDPRECVNRFFAFAIPFVWIADPDKQAVGLSLMISDIHRISPEAVDPTVKNYHWLDLVQGLFQAYDRGGESTILTNREGCLVEGPGFNVFLIKDQRLMTPSQGVLEGVTRKTVIEIAATMNKPVELGDLGVEDARCADEAFITSTAGGIMPVVEIDGVMIGTGVPGPLTLSLRDAYWAMHRDPQYSTAVDDA